MKIIFHIIHSCLFQNKSSKITSENIPLTGAFSKKDPTEENEDDSTNNNKDYTPIVHSPFGSKSHRQPVVHSPVNNRNSSFKDSPKRDKKESVIEPPKLEKLPMVDWPKPEKRVAPMETPKQTGATTPVTRTKVPTMLDGTQLQMNEIKLLKSIVCKWKEYSNKRKECGDKSSQFRKGPAPLDEGGKSKKKFVIRCSHGTLDSDVESIDSDDEDAAKLKENYASSKGLILYFAKLAVTTDEKEGIDLKFVNSLIDNGADVNCADRYGQSVLHEVSRAWHTDVAKFLLSKGAKINKGDKFGRTALHLSSAVGYAEMIEFLVQNGGNNIFVYFLIVFD